MYFFDLELTFLFFRLLSASLLPNRKPGLRSWCPSLCTVSKPISCRWDERRRKNNAGGQVENKSFTISTNLALGRNGGWVIKSLAQSVNLSRKGKLCTGSPVFPTGKWYWRGAEKHPSGHSRIPDVGKALCLPLGWVRHWELQGCSLLWVLKKICYIRFCFAPVNPAKKQIRCLILNRAHFPPEVVWKLSRRVHPMSHFLHSILFPWNALVAELIRGSGKCCLFTLSHRHSASAAVPLVS